MELTPPQKNNGKVTMAVLRNDVEHVKISMVELKSDVKEIKNMMVTQVVSNRENINRLWWLLGIIGTAILGGGSYIALH